MFTRDDEFRRGFDGAASSHSRHALDPAPLLATAPGDAAPAGSAEAVVPAGRLAEAVG